MFENKFSVSWLIKQLLAYYNPLFPSILGFINIYGAPTTHWSRAIKNKKPTGDAQLYGREWGKAQGSL